TRWKTPCTPQKQPPANTAVCIPDAAVVRSTAGGAIFTAASPARVAAGTPPATSAAASVASSPARRAGENEEKRRVMVIGSVECSLVFVGTRSLQSRRDAAATPAQSRAQLAGG